MVATKFELAPRLICSRRQRQERVRIKGLSGIQGFARGKFSERLCRSDLAAAPKETKSPANSLQCRLSLLLFHFSADQLIRFGHSRQDILQVLVGLVVKEYRRCLDERLSFGKI